ncbi:MAG: hypothetical protein C5B59_12910 [Bacteroidetes bacterium]|nr:MAG: hypothetical protein C5B59_12910 [Bacteroidota bacterium]
MSQKSVYDYKGNNQDVSVGQTAKNSGEAFHTADAIKGDGSQNRFKWNPKRESAENQVGIGDPNTPRNRQTADTLPSYYGDKFVQSGEGV